MAAFFESVEPLVVEHERGHLGPDIGAVHLVEGKHVLSPVSPDSINVALNERACELGLPL
jgi:hypothetical protein